MTTKNEYIASIMLEAAELLKLDESAGANGAGARFYDEKIKAAQNKINSLEKSLKAYERAGYSDKIPAKKKEINNLKNNIKEYKKNMNFHYNKNHKRAIDSEEEYGNKLIAEINREGIGVRGYNQDYRHAYHKNDKLREEKAKKNARINSRAAMKEAIDLLYDKAIECDTLDEATEYINKAEQLEILIGE